MARILHPKPVKLIIGFIFKDDVYFAKAKSVLLRYFGKIDFESQKLAFNYTDYYRQEFGEPLKRRFVSFQKLVMPDRLSHIKVLTNRIEKRFSIKSRRLINIDPGYLDLAKLVLATTKDFSHRIYLKDKIYAEVTLIFKDKSFQALEWTYPDYRTKEYIDMFNKIRQTYHAQI